MLVAFIASTTKSIEEKWRKIWEEERAYEADLNQSKPKFYLTVAYPYPNSPQHVGHGRTYTITDIYARYKRMRGFQVLFPMGFHYTGTPILAMAKRLASEDEELRDLFIKIYKVPEEVLKELEDPFKMARFFHEEIKTGMKEMGYSIDWRREFTTVDPGYSRFIQWQFRKLKEKGYIKIGTHPVGWCPSCGNPVGQHDTKGDVEPEVVEFVAIKFKMGDFSIPTATLRPETVFGVTNIWVNPQADYVKAIVDGEKWIIGLKASERLKHQNLKMEILEVFKGRDIVGGNAVNPINGQLVPILEAKFVDPGHATGVVMSVPSHAPYDYMALKEAKEKTGCLIEPITIISFEGAGNVPAADVCREMGIESQTDPKLEDATKELYRRELTSGIMLSNTGKYSGMRVPEARELIRIELIEKNDARVIYELSEKVYCRCGESCVVKILENQWFIDYGNLQWKEKVYECLDSMRIVPEELRIEFKNVVEWLRERACARQRGLGTKLPWDENWIIESLSDSTIYMAYYIVAKYINMGLIDPTKLNDGFFDYVLLGLGNPRDVASSIDVKTELIEEIRREFIYYYPLDSRNSGRDLVPNHLTFFIFNHVAIFPKELWPKQIVINGSVLMEGRKMSKSLGNIVPLREAVREYGADALRIAVVSTAGLLQDANFSPSLARTLADFLETLRRQYRVVATMPSSSSKTDRVDKWLISRLQETVKEVTEAFEELDVRKAVQLVLYQMDNDLNWFLRRKGCSNLEEAFQYSNILKKFMEVRAKLLAPLAPYTAEEIWSIIGERGLICKAEWPQLDSSLIDEEAEKSEEFIKELIEDTNKILRVLPGRPSRIVYYVAATWKWDVYREILSMKEPDVKTILMRLEKTGVEVDKAAIAKFIRTTIDMLPKMGRDFVKSWVEFKPDHEFNLLEEAKRFLEREFRCEVLVYYEDASEVYDPKKRAVLARPCKPAIYVEVEK
ncbi:leucine--tRNA ligase [Candidatus Bathyarchaeota archaeon]|nr:leucine--tRNA ligase [Candidatus Bathyarchaeota archaeon]MBS7618070.1 leucine--tRNA ligase [Candidatus Bathyarchaeota archaeon]